MKAFFRGLVLVPLAAVVALFAVANRAPVRIMLDPFSRDASLGFEAPLFAIVLAAVAVGVLIGGLACWLAQGKHRKAARRGRREIEALREEAHSLRAAVPDSALPALTGRGA